MTRSQSCERVLAARIGFELGTHDALIVDAVVTGVGVVLVLDALPSRPPPDAALPSERPQCSGTSSQSTRVTP